MKDDLKYLLGKNIKSERARKDFTQEQFSEMVNISLSHISKIEQGLTSPTAMVLYKMSKVLNVPMEVFFRDITVE